MVRWTRSKEQASNMQLQLQFEQADGRGNDGQYICPRGCIFLFVSSGEFWSLCVCIKLDLDLDLDLAMVYVCVERACVCVYQSRWCIPVKPACNQRFTLLRDIKNFAPLP